MASVGPRRRQSFRRYEASCDAVTKSGGLPQERVGGPTLSGLRPSVGLLLSAAAVADLREGINSGRWAQVARVGRPVLSILLGFAVMVGGCSGGSTASPAGATASVSPAPTAVATPTPADPDALFSLGIAEGPAWQSFHMKIAVGGTVKAAFLKTLGNPNWAKLTTDAVLDGTVIEGDVDAQNLAFHLAIAVPAVVAFGSAALTGDLIIKDSNLYLKMAALGAKYREVKLGTVSKELGVPVSVPTPGGSALIGLADLTSSIRSQLEAIGVTPKVVGVEQIGGRDAYHIDLTVPLDKVNSDLAAAATKASAGAAILGELKIDSISSGIWIYKDNYQLAQVQIAGTSSTAGSLSFTMTLTAFDQPVTINAPAASEVAAGL